MLPFRPEILSPSPKLSTSLRASNSGPGTHLHPFTTPGWLGYLAVTSILIITHVHFSVRAGAWVLITEPVQAWITVGAQYMLGGWIN